MERRTADEIHGLVLAACPPSWRRWCGAEGGCACMGCVGLAAGGLVRKGLITPAEAERWNAERFGCELPPLDAAIAGQEWRNVASPPAAASDPTPEDG